MKLERVESAEQMAAVAELARETWTQHYVPIVGRGQVEYMLEKFQSAEAIARQIAAEGYEYYLAPDAGYLALVPDAGAGSVMLSKIYVKAEMRGTGLGGPGGVCTGAVRGAGLPRTVADGEPEQLGVDCLLRAAGISQDQPAGAGHRRRVRDGRLADGQALAGSAEAGTKELIPKGLLNHTERFSFHAVGLAARL
jgi:hypothetical protein